MLPKGTCSGVISMPLAVARDQLNRVNPRAEMPSVAEGVIISEKVGCTGPGASIDGRIP